ncbi:PREDICTED: protein will die slowly-like [Ipomoea nil]|uniref:protein will die slowly-like n=1 Tax=Ipomoea nil TaxID=35883 RepID=UPI0009017A87|nr:PREDICTED: protein will die slowly-like [Ipomoea nil]
MRTGFWLHLAFPLTSLCKSSFLPKISLLNPSFYRSRIKKMPHSRPNLPVPNTTPPHSTPPSLSSLSATSSSNGSAASSDLDESPAPSRRYDSQDLQISRMPVPAPQSHKPLAVLSGHVGAVSCIALCGEFVLSASQGKDIIVWQNPDLRQFTKFGEGDGSVKAVLTVGTKVFTAHQDSKIRVWKVSRKSENVFRLVDTLPTTKDYLRKFLRQSNYVQTRRHHKKLWIEHADSISCLAVTNGYIYSGSWDKTLKVWRISDLKCLESIKAHDDAINGLVASKGVVYSSSADGKIKAWGKEGKNMVSLKGVLEGHRENVSMNGVVVSGDGSLVYGARSDGYVMGWLRNGDSEKWKKVCEVKAHEMAVLSLCVMGEFLCSGSADKSIRVWKKGMNGGLVNVGVINGHEGAVRCLQASPVSVGGGFMVYSGSLDRSLRVWWVPNYDTTEKSSQMIQSTDLQNPKFLLS